MLNKIKRYSKIYIKLLNLSLKTELEYRANFFIEVIGALLRVASFWILIEIIFLNTDSLVGWSKYEVILIFGYFRFTMTVLNGFIMTNLKRFAEDIPEGKINQLILKPLNLKFFVSLFRVEVSYLSKGLAGLVIMIYAFVNLDVSIQLFDVLVLLYLFILLGVIIFGVLLTFFSSAFWFGRVSHGFWVYDVFTDLSKLPINAFRGIWEIIFVFVIPYALFEAVPIAFLLDRLDYAYLIIYTGIAILWWCISEFIFKKGLDSYVSGGG